MPRRERSLKELSHVHGGKYIVQSGKQGEKPRYYWQIMHSLQPRPVGYLVRSSQIHESWAMTLQMMEDKKWRRTLPTYALVYITKGKGFFLDNKTGIRQTVQAGSLLCLFPGIGHVYGPDPGTRWNEISIDFSGLVFDAWCGPELLDPLHPVRHLGTGHSWLESFHQIVLPLAKPAAEPALGDSGKLLALIGRLCESWQSHGKDMDLQWAEKAKRQLLQLPPGQPLNLAQMGKRLGIGEQAYRKKFARICGMTPTSFRSRHLVEQACLLLSKADTGIKEIAFCLGFGSAFYFSRRFKQITGFSPGQYRTLARH